jgi:hypothetical protein
MEAEWKFVSAAFVYETLARGIGPACPGFAFARKGVLLKQATPDIGHVIKLVQYKGGEYGFRWGVSLSYVPHEWKNRVAWHRTAKSARLDLSDRVEVDLENRDELPGDELLYASYIHGENQFTRELKRAWGHLNSVIFASLEQLSDLAGVLAKAEQQEARTWRGPRHWPPPALVHAFTMAKLGRREEAAKELEELCREEDFDPNRNLMRALEKVR